MLSLVILLFGFAHSRSVQLDLSSPLKVPDVRYGSNVNNYEILYNTEHMNFAVENENFVDNEKSKNVGFILFGNMEDFKKYRLDSADEKSADTSKIDEDFAFKSEYEDQGDVRNKLNYVRENSQKIIKIDEIDSQEETGEEKQEEELNINLKHEAEYDEPDDSQDYRNIDESKSEDSGVVVDIFSEDEYNDYDTANNAAEEVSSEEDSDEKEIIYDEEEKYYEEENEQFYNINEEESAFNDLFMLK